MDRIQEFETLLRFSFFAGILAVMLIWESLAPRRRAQERRLRHASRNLGLVVIDSLFVRLVIPVVPVAAAMFFFERGWGLFNQLSLPAWLTISLSVLALDFAIYLQHVGFHAVPVLWRLHKVHHTDLDFDATTGLRFHPIEIFLSLAIKIVLVAMLGAPAAGVLLFEIILNASSLFNHGNVRIPPGLDRILRFAMVTPDMHRVHHSTLHQETNSNFGFFLAWWDRLAGTYIPRPRDSHERMRIGLDQHRQLQELTLPRLLMLPFADHRARPGADRDDAPDSGTGYRESA